MDRQTAPGQGDCDGRCDCCLSDTSLAHHHDQTVIALSELIEQLSQSAGTWREHARTAPDELRAITRSEHGAKWHDTDYVPPEKGDLRSRQVDQFGGQT